MKNIEKDWLILLMLSLGLNLAGAQPDSVLVTKNFKFEDGVYLTAGDWQQNRPAFTWEELDASLATNPQTFITQVESIRVRDSGASISPDSIWGISLGGIPYIRLDREASGTKATAFAGLRVRGKICYFSYPQDVTRQVQIKAYNPVTGRPFRSGVVDRTETVLREWMLDFRTGEVAEFNVENFQGWIADDPQLQRTVRELSPEEVEEKLFRCLLIYVDRNEVRLATSRAEH